MTNKEDQTKPNSICVNHDWVFENRMLLSDPPQRNKVCRKCGERGRDTIGEPSKDEYSEIMKKITDNPKSCAKVMNFCNKCKKMTVHKAGVIDGCLECGGHNPDYTNFIKEIRKIPINSREKQIIEMVIEKLKTSDKGDR